MDTEQATQAPTRHTRLRPSTRPQKTLSPKQLLYADYVASGMPKGQAALKAGYKATQAAYKADHNPLVQQHVERATQLSRVQTAYTVSAAMQEAERAMQFGFETKNANAVVKACELRAKLSGLLIERVEVFSADLRGALLEASKRVIQSSPNSYSVLPIEPEPASEEGGVGAGATPKIPATD